MNFARLRELYDPVKTPAAGCGLLGAFLVAMPATMQAGFGTWIVGNALWVYHGWQVKDLHVVLLFGVYFVTAAASLINHGGM